MSLQGEESASRVLSVRIPENIHFAYDQVQGYYLVSPSDLIRMAPLLLVLVAEGFLAPRRKDVQKKEEELENQLRHQKIDWDGLRKKLRDLDQEKAAISNNELMGRDFIEHLHKLANEANNTDVIHPVDIQEGKDGFPEYSIFQAQLLRQAAQEMADEVMKEESLDEEKIRALQAYNKYDGQLLAISRKRLGGRDLDENQKTNVRQQFLNALWVLWGFSKDNWNDALRDAAYEVARDRVRPEDVPDLLKQVCSNDPPEIPRRYDGQLLAISRRKLGKPLNMSEKSEVRRRFRDALQKIDELQSRSVP